MIQSSRIARSLQYAFPVAAVLGVGGLLALDRSNLSVLAVYIAAPLIVGSVAHRRRAGHDAALPSAPSSFDYGPRLRRAEHAVAFKGLLALYAGLQAISIALLATVDVRPLAYYAVVAVALTVVLAQILYFEPEPGTAYLILGQIGLALLNVLWGLTFKYHYYFGVTDVFPHVWYTTLLITDGHVVPGFQWYRSFPLWHLLNAVEYTLLGGGMRPRHVLFLTSGIVYAVFVVAVYALVERLFRSRTIGLLAALATSVNTFVIIYGTESISRSVVSFLTVALLLLMIEYRDAIPYAALYEVLVFGVVAYHTVSTPFLAVVFGTIYAAQLLLFRGTDRPVVRFRHLAVIAVIQAYYWLVHAEYMATMVLDLFVSPSVSSVGTPNQGITLQPYHELANYLQFAVVLFFVVYGILSGLSSRRIPERGKIVLVAAVVLSVVSFPGPLLLLQGFEQNFNVLRFGQYTIPIISAAVAVGIAGLVSTRQDGRSVSRSRALVLALFVTGAFFGLSNDFVASDNPLVEREFYTFYLTESERHGMDAVSRLAGGYVMADHVTCRYLDNSRRGSNCHILEGDVASARLLTRNDSDLILIRTTELSKRGLRVVPRSEFEFRPSYLNELQYVHEDAPLWEDLRYRNKVYSTNGVDAYAEGRRR